MALNRDFQQQQGTNSDFKDSNKKNTLKRGNEEDTWLDKISQGKKTVEELIPLIISEIEAGQIYYKHAAQMCVHLDRIMRFFYEDLNVKAVPFGSVATNLAIRNSDVDIFLDFRENLPEPAHKLLRTLKNKIRKFGYFKNPIPISAKIPIIQTVHCSGISCDLSFLNAAAISNSHLIKFLLSLDVRIRPLTLILKYLIKKQGLLGPKCVTSYALVVLIVFFLQTLKNPLIPSISLLQKLAKKSNFVANWDVSFITETDQLSKINNSMLVTELLQRFFQFYSSFEFGFYVISIYTGKSYLKTIFSDTDLLPEEFNLYKKNLLEGKCEDIDYKKFICVQDPFHHCTNITRNTTQKSLIHFQQLCKVYGTNGNDLWEKNVPEEKKIKYLTNLFKEKVDEPLKKNILLVDSIFIFLGQNLAFDERNFSEDDLRKKWSENIFNSVVDILSKVMKCELDIQNQEIGGASTSCGNSEKLINCDLLYSELITKKRIAVRSDFEFPEDMPVIKQEEIISNFMYDTILKDSTKKKSFKFVISCTIKRGPTCFCMELSPAEKVNINMMQQVFKFIQNAVVKWIK